MTRFLFAAGALASAVAASTAGAADISSPGNLAAVNAAGPGSGAAAPAFQPALTVAQIIDKNVAARGGLEAWRKIRTMMWIGEILAPASQAPIVPFMMQMERPNKTHFEIDTQGHKTARIFDGTEGWQIRMGHGKPDLKPYTLDQLTFARDAQVIDGYLIDYQAKGIAIDADGIDEIEGKKAYRLNVTLPSGSRERIWVDAQTFLEIKSEHAVRSVAGLQGWVPVYYRNYQTVDGLQIPFTVETASAPDRPGDKLVIKHVILNPRVDERAFSKPVPPHIPGQAAAGAAGGPMHRGTAQRAGSSAPASMLDAPRSTLDAPPSTLSAQPAQASHDSPSAAPAQ